MSCKDNTGDDVRAYVKRPLTLLKGHLTNCNQTISETSSVRWGKVALGFVQDRVRIPFFPESACLSVVLVFFGIGLD